MTTQRELQDRTTPEFIKWCCEYAEGFSSEREYEIFFNNLRVDRNIFVFPLILHRTVEGWNRTKDFLHFIMPYEDGIAKGDGKTFFEFKHYTGTTLTPCECAILHCLLDIFERDGY